MMDELEKALSVFWEHEGKEDDELVAALLQRGHKLEEAEHIVVFAPIAFGFVLIRHIAPITLPKTYTLRDNPKEYRFSDEPLFAQLLQLAMVAYHDGHLGQEGFKAIAFRSADVNAVNNALNGGMSVDDLAGGTLSPPIIFGFKTIGKRQGLLKRLFGR